MNPGIRRYLHSSLSRCIPHHWAFVLVIAILALSGQKSVQANEARGQYVIQPGDTWNSIAIRYGTTASDVARMNRALNPQQPALPMGLTVDVPAGQPTLAAGQLVQAGADTLVARLAAKAGQSLWAVLQLNALPDAEGLAQGQVVILPGSGPLRLLPAPLNDLAVHPAVAIQGKTFTLRVGAPESAQLGGKLDQGRYGQQILHFDRSGANAYAFVGLGALFVPGNYPLTLTITSTAGTLAYTWPIQVVNGNYEKEEIDIPPGNLQQYDPNVAQAEWARLTNIHSKNTPEKLWDGPFRIPVANPRITDNYGVLRSYNGGPYNSYHEGTDYGGLVGDPVYAVARGRVVLAEKLAVRGNVVILDHGWGVFSEYYHQSQLLVQEGQMVEAGQQIGKVGATGIFVTGSHLHLSVVVNGVYVDPLQWINQSFP